MQVLQAANRSSHDVLWKTPTRLAGEQPFRFPVGEAPYHPMTPCQCGRSPSSDDKQIVYDAQTREANPWLNRSSHGHSQLRSSNAPTRSRGPCMLRACSKSPRGPRRSRQGESGHRSMTGKATLAPEKALRLPGACPAPFTSRAGRRSTRRRAVRSRPPVRRRTARPARTSRRSCGWTAGPGSGSRGWRSTRRVGGRH